jgi:hypothetical protein
VLTFELICLIKVKPLDLDLLWVDFKCTIKTFEIKYVKNVYFDLKVKNYALVQISIIACNIFWTLNYYTIWINLSMSQVAILQENEDKVFLSDFYYWLSINLFVSSIFSLQDKLFDILVQKMVNMHSTCPQPLIIYLMRVHTNSVLKSFIWDPKIH